MARRSSPGRYPRTARVGELIREIVAETLERIDDERLLDVAITSVSVDADLQRAIVRYDALGGEEVDEEVLAAFAEHRARLRRAVGEQTRMRRTPDLAFYPDEVERRAQQIEGILRDLDPPGDDGSPPA